MYIESCQPNHCHCLSSSRRALDQCEWLEHSSLHCCFLFIIWWKNTTKVRKLLVNFLCTATVEIIYRTLRDYMPVTTLNSAASTSSSNKPTHCYPQVQQLDHFNLQRFLSLLFSQRSSVQHLLYENICPSVCLSHS